MNNLNLVELSQEEINTIDGGFEIGVVLGVIAITGAIYTAGTYVGEALYHATH